MQGNMVELIRELMQTQQMSIRKISAKIAKEHGSSALGYTQQINRILNDPDYDPNFSTIQKILAALNCSIWQVPLMQASGLTPELTQLEQRLELLSDEIVAVKLAMTDLQQAIAQIAQFTEAIAHHLAVPDSPHHPLPPKHDYR